jgi:hypothetical protein
MYISLDIQKHARPEYLYGDPRNSGALQSTQVLGSARLDPTDMVYSVSAVERSTSNSERHTQRSEALSHLYESASALEYFGLP